MTRPSPSARRRGRLYVASFATLAGVLEQARAGKRVVAFDVFDTLLRRRVEPEWVKDRIASMLATCPPHASHPQAGCRWKGGRTLVHDAAAATRRIRKLRRALEATLAQQHAAAGRDGEFTLRELLAALLPKVGLPADPPQVEALFRHELELERLATDPTPGIAGVLTTLAAAGVSLVFISDMYLGADAIRGLLDHHGLARCFQRGFCSCDVGASKRTGRLFEHVLTELALAPSELLFVGDSLAADVRPARRLGIDVVHVRDRRELRRRRRLVVLAELARRRRWWQGRHACELIEQDADLPDPAGTATRVALLLAPALTAFVLDLLDQVRRRRLDQLAFISREGPTLLRIYRRLRRRLDPDAPLGVFLPVSRRSTFLAALPAFDPAALEPLWRRYPQQSLRTLLASCSLPDQPFIPLAAQHGLPDPDRILEAGPAAPPLCRWLADPQVQSAFRQHRDRARTLLFDLLRQRGLLDGTRTVGLVDIGWFGSIQDNLQRLLTTLRDPPRLVGLYLGLLSRRPDPDRLGFLADIRRGDFTEQAVFSNGAIFEIFTSVACGTITGYHRRRGRVRPQLEPDPAASAMRPIASAVRRELFAWAERFAACWPLAEADAAALRLAALDRLRRFVLYPTRAEARWFFTLTHGESFGRLGSARWGPPLRWRDVLRGGPLHTMPKRIIQNLERTFWPQGYLRRLPLPLATLAWDLLETYYHSRPQRSGE